mgnify:CR=1 FL=1
MQSKISIVKLDTEISPSLLSKAYALNQLNVPEVGSLKDEQEFRTLIDVAKINFFVYKDNAVSYTHLTLPTSPKV